MKKEDEIWRQIANYLYMINYMKEILIDKVIIRF